jgi:ABC-type sulfate transport system permease component
MWIRVLSESTRRNRRLRACRRPAAGRAACRRRIALLFLLGRTGWVGGPAARLGVSFYGSQWGIVAAMLFVSAPFAVNSARVAFEAIDPRLEHAARSLGASPWHAFR